MRRILSSRWAPQNDIISEESRFILRIAPVSTNAELLNGIIYLVLICIYIAKTKKTDPDVLFRMRVTEASKWPTRHFNPYFGVNLLQYTVHVVGASIERIY